MKYTTILPAFLFLAGSALLPISSYAEILQTGEIKDGEKSEVLSESKPGLIERGEILNDPNPPQPGFGSSSTMTGEKEMGSKPLVINEDEASSEVFE